MTAPALLIRDPGPATTVQDFGRPAARRLGVPVAGTLCPDWLALANGLLGNTPDAAGLEFRALGPRFEVLAEEVTLVIGGPAEMQITSGQETRVIPPWTATRARQGETVAVGRITGGTTAVLAVAGGIATPPFLGSRATYARAALGGLEGRALQPNDCLPLGDAAAPELKALDVADDPVKDPIRVILGPQDDYFDPDMVTLFLSQTYTVTPNLDRMGMRLDGTPLVHKAPEQREIVSDGIVPGAVQVPGNGRPIVLLADGQTVGGYPKIATVISADLPRLARRAPGEEVRFTAVSPDEAEAALRAELAARGTCLASAKPVGEGTGIDLRSLYESNLISGVVGEIAPE